MEIIKIDLKNPSISSVEKAVSVLKKGGVVIAPSDTCYGLMCDIRSRKAVEKIYKVKQRDKSLPLSINVNSDLLNRYVNISEDQKKIVKKYLPGRYTLILPSSNLVPNYINNFTETVGIRIMECVYIEQVVKKLNSAVITTSANVSGKSVKYKFSEVLSELENSRIDLAIDGGKLEGQSPSKIIKVSDSGLEEILRE